MQLPHRVLEYLLTSCKLEMRDDLIQAWWDHLDSINDVWASSTRVYRRAVGETVVPVGLFGDECDMSFQNAPNSAIYGVFLNLPFFRPKSSRMTRFLLFSIESSRVWKADLRQTFDPVMSAIVWSINQTTERGCAGRKFLCSEIRGDQVWIRALFTHASYWKANSVCFRCRATSKPTDMNYMLYSSPTGWETTLRTTEQFLMEELKLPWSAFVVHLVLMAWWILK